MPHPIAGLPAAKYLRVSRMIVATIFFGGSALLRNIELRTFCLFVGAALSCATLAELIAEARALPRLGLMRLGVAVSMLASAIFYLLLGSSTTWSAFAWLCLMYALLAVIAASQRVFFDILLLSRLASAMRTGTLPPAFPPLVYVLAEPGFAVHSAYRFTAKLAKAVWRYGQVSPEVYESIRPLVKRVPWSSGMLRRLRAGRIPIAVLVSDSLRSKPIEFRLWLARNSALLIAMRIFPTSAQQRQFTNKKDSTFEHQLEVGYQNTPGPSILVALGEAPEARWADQIVTVEPSPSMFTLDDEIAAVAQRVASNVVPICLSDAELAPSLRALIPDFADRYAPPFSDCYLRFRLAESDVERFAALIEGIEALVRGSVVLLQASSWRSGGVEQALVLDKPLTLGGWQKALKTLLPRSALPQYVVNVAAFWAAPVFESQLELVEIIEKSGPDDALVAGGLIGGEQHHWLEWFIRLRNATRGHGFMTERAMRVLWRGLHIVFLQMCYGLADLTRDSQLVVCSSHTSARLAGWFRAGRRVHSNSIRERTAFVACILPDGNRVALHPFVQVVANEILYLDMLSPRNQTYEFLNYSSSKRQALSEIPSQSLFQLWRMAQEHVDRWPVGTHAG